MAGKEGQTISGAGTYNIGLHTVYCYYLREVLRIPEPKEGRVVLFLDGSGLEGQPPKAGRQRYRSRR